MVRKEVYRVRNERWNIKVDSLSFENHSLWKMTKSLTTTNTHPTPLLHNNTYFSDPQTKANLHANYLGEIMSALLILQTKDKHIINHNKALDLQPIDKPDLIDPTEIKMNIASLHNRKAPGIDQITNHIHIQTKIHNILSNITPLAAGLPQGSILSSILFNCIINDIPASPKVKNLLFADDTAFLTQSTNPDLSVSNLNKHLKKYQR
ncbi:hypothetical protein J437_LFUL018241, partial [Ladona fulva]